MGESKIFIGISSISGEAGQAELCGERIRMVMLMWFDNVLIRDRIYQTTDGGDGSVCSRKKETKFLVVQMEDKKKRQGIG